MKRSMIASGVMLLTLAAAGCETTTAGKAASKKIAPETLSAASYVDKARVVLFTQACTDVRTKDLNAKNTNESVVLTALISIFAPIVADTIVGVVNNQLEAWKNARTGTFTATGLAIPKGDLQYKCLAIVKGRFGDPAASSQAPTDPSAELKAVALKNFQLQQAPEFLLTLKLTPGIADKDGNVPVSAFADYLHYGKTSARSEGSGAKSVSVAISITAAAKSPAKTPSKPAEKIAKQPEGAAKETDGAAKETKDAAKNAEGGTKPAEDAANSGDKGKGDAQASTASPNPAGVTSNALLNLQKREIGKYYSGTTLAGDGVVFYLPSPKDSYGWSVSAVVTETEDPVLALKLFVDGTKEKSDEISKAISDWIKKQAGVDDESDKGGGKS